jgi:hypothetical protein
MFESPALQSIERAWLLDGLLAAFVPADLTRLKHGRYATGTVRRCLAALAHFAHWMALRRLPAALNAVRGDYAPHIEFLVADVDTESGKAFMRTQQVGAAALLLFGPDGARHGVLPGPLDKEGLRAALDAAYGGNR